MKLNFVFLSLLLLLSGGEILAQNGGKAEPKQITFAKGKSSAIETGRIAGSEQAEYSFTARIRQTVTLKITSIPKGKFAAFQVQNALGSPKFTTDYDSNYDYTFKAPYTGDYMIFVRFRPAGKTTSAKYTLTLSIK